MKKRLIEHYSETNSKHIWKRINSISDDSKQYVAVQMFSAIEKLEIALLEMIRNSNRK